MSYFADQLKKLRTQSGLTMQTLATAANVSKSMICKIENDEVQPTIDIAARLAMALGITLSEMLHAAQKTQVIFIPKKEQALWEDSNHVKRRNISPVFEGLKIEWLHVELPGETFIDKIPLHTLGSEKFILVTKGSLDITINQEHFHLKKGDSLYFDAASPHKISNPGKETMEYYIVIKHK